MARLTITHTHGLTLTDLRKLEKQQDNVQLRLRITAVRLVMEGHTGKEVANLCNVHRQSVAAKKFNTGGIDALLERKYGPGRPCFLTTEQQNEWKHVILTGSPSDYGLGGCATSWITPIIREYVRNTYDVGMSCPGILRMLWRLCLSYTCPICVLAKADSEKQQAFEHEIDLIKKLLNNDTVLLCQDGTHVRAY
ncbi:helix-turn-helix domain-containing protein [Parageobacillus thermoglucosidasius]|uniref:DNA-binding protein n=1 Tax=Parageobacillus thermoglucosidasius TaxID=1426 RepID=A0A1B7KMX2_PARTM|nr:helix-turn-helix domain-containing protein [Parageobacillus thermoglucosidasius]OAT71412.1 DNA-binding protein [Parageobacillus thermoglucosidasius]